MNNNDNDNYNGKQRRDGEGGFGQWKYLLQSNSLKQRRLNQFNHSGSLPFQSLADIVFHENEFVTDVTFNIAFHHLLDNDLFLENFIYEKNESKTSGDDDQLSIVGLDSIDSLSLYDVSEIRAAMSSLVIGVSENGAAFFEMRPRNRVFGPYLKYENEIENYDYSRDYRRNRILNVGGNEIYIMKDGAISRRLEDGSADSYMFVEITDVGVNIPASRLSIPEFSDGEKINALIANKFGVSGYSITEETSKPMKLLFSSKYLIATNMGLYGIGGDYGYSGTGRLSDYRIEFLNTKSISDYAMISFHNIGSEITLVIYAIDNGVSRLFYISPSTYSPIYGGLLLREISKIYLDGVSASIGEFTDSIHGISECQGDVLALADKSFLRFTPFQNGFPTNDRYFLNEKSSIASSPKVDYERACFEKPWTSDNRMVNFDATLSDTISGIDGWVGLSNDGIYNLIDDNGSRIVGKKFPYQDEQRRVFNFAVDDMTISNNGIVAISDYAALVLSEKDGSTELFGMAPPMEYERVWVLPDTPNEITPEQKRQFMLIRRCGSSSGVFMRIFDMAQKTGLDYDILYECFLSEFFSGGLTKNNILSKYKASQKYANLKSELRDVYGKYGQPNNYFKRTFSLIASLNSDMTYTTSALLMSNSSSMSDIREKIDTIEQASYWNEKSVYSNYSGINKDVINKKKSEAESLANGVLVDQSKSILSKYGLSSVVQLSSFPTPTAVEWTDVNESIDNLALASGKTAFENIIKSYDVREPGRYYSSVSNESVSEESAKSFLFECCKTTNLYSGIYNAAVANVNLVWKPYIIDGKEGGKPHGIGDIDSGWTTWYGSLGNRITNSNYVMQADIVSVIKVAMTDSSSAAAGYDVCNWFRGAFVEWVRLTDSFMVTKKVTSTKNGKKVTDVYNYYFEKTENITVNDLSSWNIYTSTPPPATWNQDGSIALGKSNFDTYALDVVKNKYSCYKISYVENDDGDEEEQLELVTVNWSTGTGEEAERIRGLFKEYVTEGLADFVMSIISAYYDYVRACIVRYIYSQDGDDYDTAISLLPFRNNSGISDMHEEVKRLFRNYSSDGLSTRIPDYKVCDAIYNHVTEGLEDQPFARSMPSISVIENKDKYEIPMRFMWTATIDTKYEKGKAVEPPQSIIAFGDDRIATFYFDYKIIVDFSLDGGKYTPSYSTDIEDNTKVYLSGNAWQWKDSKGDTSKPTITTDDTTNTNTTTLEDFISKATGLGTYENTNKKVVGYYGFKSGNKFENAFTKENIMSSLVGAWNGNTYIDVSGISKAPWWMDSVMSDNKTHTPFYARHSESGGKVVMLYGLFNSTPSKIEVSNTFIGGYENDTIKSFLNNVRWIFPNASGLDGSINRYVVSTKSGSGSIEAIIFNGLSNIKRGMDICLTEYSSTKSLLPETLNADIEIKVRSSWNDSLDLIPESVGNVFNESAKSECVSVINKFLNRDSMVEEDDSSILSGFKVMSAFSHDVGYQEIQNNLENKVLDQINEYVGNVWCRYYCDFSQFPRKFYNVKYGAVDNLVGVSGRKVMTINTVSLRESIENNTFDHDSMFDVFDGIKYDVLVLPGDCSRITSATTSCSNLVFWCNNIDSESDSFDRPYVSFSNLSLYVKYFDANGVEREISNLVYNNSVCFVVLSGENDIRVFDIDDTVSENGVSISFREGSELAIYRTLYSGDSSVKIVSMLLSDRVEPSEYDSTRPSWNGKYRLLLCFGKKSGSGEIGTNNVEVFEFTGKLESGRFSLMTLSNVFTDRNLSTAYYQFLDNRVLDFGESGSSVVVFSDGFATNFSEGYSFPMDITPYPNLPKMINTASSVYPSYFLDDDFVLNCIGIPSGFSDLYPYATINLGDFISVSDSGFEIYDIDMSSWKEDASVSYILVYSNRGMYTIDMGSYPSRVEYDDISAMRKYFTGKVLNLLKKHNSVKHGPKSILSRFNASKMEISDCSIYELSPFKVNGRFLPVTEQYGVKSDEVEGHEHDSDTSVTISTDVIRNGTSIGTKSSNPGIVFAAVSSPISRIDQSWGKSQIASVIKNTSFYDYFFKTETTPAGSKAIKEIVNLNRLPFIYRSNSDGTWEMYVNIPTTMTPYMNRVAGSNYKISGTRMKVEKTDTRYRKNLSGKVSSASPKDDSTVVRLFIDLGYFNILSVLDVEVSGSSAPMLIYREKDANEGLYDDVAIRTTWNRKVSTVGGEHDEKYAMVEFSVWGTDEQSVRLRGESARNLTAID